MKNNAATNLDLPELPQADPVGVLRWFAFCAVLLAVCITGLIVLARQMNVDVDRLADWRDAMAAWKQNWHSSLAAWKQLWGGLLRVVEVTPAEFKLLFLLTYLTICTTLTPLPTGPVVAAMAMQEVAVGGGLWSTTLLVAVVGAAGTTVANLTDYAVFTLLLRRRRIARIRETKTFQIAQRWFARGPFLILTLFNLLLIPVDVIRLLAITCRYARLHFAAASFIGRFARYGVIAFVTYSLPPDLSWTAPVALLALATVLAIGKGVTSLLQRKQRVA
ncbi:MAG: hypothetical protein FWE88_07870 [Phycisphaerae bacterium]|nr:hypothetical protein [Phycisphaerae bacterium]